MQKDKYNTQKDVPLKIAIVGIPGFQAPLPPPPFELGVGAIGAIVAVCFLVLLLLLLLLFTYRTRRYGH